MASVTLEKVARRFGRSQAVADLSLSVAEGERFVLLGPSGAGKSTTLRMIAGLDEPDAGTIRIGDRIVNRLDPRTRDVGMVFQDDALYPHLNVAENLGFPLRHRGIVGDELGRRVRVMADRLEITGLLDRRPAALSGGERRRVALGRALIREPEVLLLDEPSGRLDPTLRRGLRAQIRDLGGTAIVVTHDQEEALALADRLAILRAGRLVQVGVPREVFDRPADRFVAGFLGTPPMALVPGRIEIEADRPAFVAGSLPPVPLDVRMRDRVGRPCALGFRGAGATSRPEGSSRAVAWPVMVCDRRDQGDFVEAAYEAAGVRFSLRRPTGIDEKIGSVATLFLDPAACLVYENGADGPLMA